MNGIAKTDIQIQDLSILSNTGAKGIIAVCGITERGPINQPTVVSSWIEFTRTFGSFLEDDLFPLLCKRALDAGAKLRVSRIAHYIDNSGVLSLDGVIASKTISGLVFKALSIGSWGNKLKVSLVDNSSVLANTFKLSISLDTDSSVNETYVIKKDITQLDLNDVLQKTTLLSEISFVSGNTLTLVAGESYLENGAQDISLITSQDYIGYETNESGIYAFNNYSDFTRISIPSKAESTIDTALIAYVERRKDCMAILRTPVGIKGASLLSYRGIHNSWKARMVTGGLKITHPVSGLKLEIPEIGDVLGLLSTKDNQYAEWFSGGGPKRGLINNALGVVYDLGNASRQGEADTVDANGIEPVINHPTYGIVFWGNSTLLRENTLLKHANVAELMIYITRELKPIIESELFNPNDIETWKAVHRKVTPMLEDIKNRRGLWKYQYQGDQDIDDIKDATINTPANIDAGQYVFHLFVAPKVSMKYLGVKVAISNSGVDFKELSL